MPEERKNKMVKHIILWKLKEEFSEEENKARVAI